MRFTLRAPPEQRLDLSPLVPDRLAGLDQAAIERVGLNTTRATLCVGDVFTVRMGDPARVTFDGGSERFDNLGESCPRARSWWKATPASSPDGA